MDINANIEVIKVVCPIIGTIVLAIIGYAFYFFMHKDNLKHKKEENEKDRKQAKELLVLNKLDIKTLQELKEAMTLLDEFNKSLYESKYKNSPEQQLEKIKEGNMIENKENNDCDDERVMTINKDKL